MRGPTPAKLQAAQKLYRKGLALQGKGQLGEAVSAYEKALGAAPDHFAILTNLGVCLGLLGRHRKALPLLRRAQKARPGEPMIEGALGAALVQLGRGAEALPLLEAAVRRMPHDRQTLLFLGLAYEGAGRPADALAAVERAAVGNTPLPAALRELARMYGADLRRKDEAVTAERAYAADPAWIEPNVRAYFARQFLLDWPALARLDVGNPLERLLKDKTAPTRPEAYLGDPFALLARTDEAAVLRKAAERRADWLVTRHGIERPSIPASARRAALAPLRVGYLSSDFRDHAVMHVMAGVFRAHDRGRVAIHAYAHGPDSDDPYRRLVRETAVTFRDLNGLGPAEAGAQIKSDDLDLLIDLNGYTAHSRIEIAALRPAPVQACFLGYPGTTGASFIDYAIVDESVAPSEQAEAFSEILAYHPVCYLPVDPEQPVSDAASSRADWGLPEDAAVFCSFNQPYKIEPLRFDSWMKILRALEGSVMWFSAMAPEICARLRGEAEARGVAGERMLFAERVEKDAHFERMRHVTAALDTRLYNGHTTTTDALLAGTPVIATEGRSFPGRVAAALLRSAGLEGLVAGSEDAYCATAIRLAQDLEYRNGVVSALRIARRESPLFDPAQYTRGLEDLFERLVAEGPATARASRAPVTLS